MENIVGSGSGPNSRIDFFRGGSTGEMGLFTLTLVRQLESADLLVLLAGSSPLFLYQTGATP